MDKTREYTCTMYGLTMNNRMFPLEHPHLNASQFLRMADLIKHIGDVIALYESVVRYDARAVTIYYTL